MARPPKPQGRTPRSESRKQRLAARFHNWPLIRLLIVSFWFRLTVLCFLAAGLLIAVMLPKVWRATPKDFEGSPVKISLLDAVQAWSLRRTARIAEADGDLRAAFDAWRAAWANNVADLSSIRGVLSIVPKVKEPERTMAAAAVTGGWLYRLGHTNVEDLQLLSRAWVNSGLSDRAVMLLSSRRGNMPPPLEHLYVMALANDYRTGEFRSRMATNAILQAEVNAAARGEQAPAPGANSPSEPHFDVYCLAYLLGWGDAEQRLQARAGLRAAREQTETAALAYDLEFSVFRFKGDTEECGRLLEELKRLARATVRHHIAYWELLQRDARENEAKDLAKQANLVPNNALDAYRLAQALANLKLWDDAENLLQHFTETSGWAAEMMEFEADLLIRAKKWDRLRGVARNLRLTPMSTELLGGYPTYLEGLAELKTAGPTSTDNARRLFEQANEMDYKDPYIALKVATNLVANELQNLAEPLLLKHMNELSDAPLNYATNYYSTLLLCAMKMKEDKYLLYATTNLYNLSTNVLTVNNKAAALLICRQEPEEALSLSLKVYRSFPNSPDALLNYLSALAQNRRYEEAKTSLLQMLPQNLREKADQAQYYLTLFEVYQGTGDTRGATNTLQQLEQYKAELYPVQLDWLQKEREKLEKPGESKG